MIPLRDNNPTSRFPIITVLLIAINIFVYFTQPVETKPYYEMIPADITSGQAVSGILQESSDGTLHFTPEPPDVVARQPDDTGRDMPVLPTIQPVWLTIFTAMFLHANFLHIAGNMLFLWIFGNNVEDALGRLRYLIFYLGCGVVAALAQIAVDPHSLIPTLGASGAIAGVLGAYIVMWPEARVKTLVFLAIFITVIDISAFWVIGIWIGLQIIEGFTGLGGMETGGVAYFAHIGGFLAGILGILALGGRALGNKQRRLANTVRYRS